MTTHRYTDLIDRHTGHVNRAAFNAILAATVRAETNLAICVRAGRLAPAIRYSELRAWRAEQAAIIGDNLTPAEHAEIERVERGHLENLVYSMREARTEADRQIAAEAA